jgi:hypothetical protein
MSKIAELIVEAKQLPVELAAVAEAIVYFVAARSGQNWQKDDSGRWRPLTENPVTLKPQWKRAQSLAITLRGNPHEFEMHELLELKKDQNGYSAFRVDSPDQAAAAFAYIDRAYTIFERGRARLQTSPKTIE